MQQKRIPLAWTARWRRIRLQVIPVVCFALAVASCSWLWHRHGAMVHGVGEVDALQVDVTSPTAGLLVALPHELRGQWTLLDRVEAGDVLARFDDRPLVAEQNQLLAELRQLDGRIRQWKTDSAAGLDGEASQTVGKAADTALARLALIEESLATGQTVGVSFTNEDASVELPESLPISAQNSWDSLCDAVRAAEFRAENLHMRRELLEVHAPISGTLVAVHCWPGQSVAQGGRIATIAADYGRHIVSYVPEDSSIVPEPGMLVTIRPRTVGGRRFDSEIEEVGRQIERLPGHLSPKSSQWGLPVRVRMPTDATLRPGAVVDVVFYQPE